jgi:hypothetical protein
MTIYLDYYRAKIVDLNEYYNKYDSNRTTYSLLKGAPLLVNVEGSYIDANALPNLVCNKRFVIIVNQYLLELRNPIDKSKSTLNFKWRR